MVAISQGEWLARGRAHQSEGRAIDALQCFRQAQRVAPRAIAPRFLLGQLLWQLGKVQDAIVAWRQALAIAPGDINLLLPLAESLLATGLPGEAREFAARAVALEPARGHATALRAIAAMAVAGATNDEEAMAELATLLAREAWLLGIPMLAGPLALALDAATESPGRAALAAVLAGLPAALGEMPPLLLALALEHASKTHGGPVATGTAELLAVAAARGYTADDQEALRRIALAAAQARSPVARGLIAHYATVCDFATVVPFPLAWPRRCAGDRLRIVALVAGSDDAAVAGILAALAALPGDAFEITLAGSHASMPASMPPAAVHALPLPPAGLADPATGRHIAALDPDILIDLVGLTAAVGPLLAQRPARRIVTCMLLAAPNDLPLVDDIVPSAESLAALLAGARDEWATLPSAPLDARAMGEAWEAAVRAHQQGDHAAAQLQYSRVLDLQPRFAPAHYLRAILCRQRGEPAAARDGFAAALALAPHYLDARLAAARLAQDCGDAAGAARLCAEGLAEHPRQVELLRTAGLAELARRDGGAAAAFFERALAIEPTDGDTHYNHGVALQMQGEPAAAARAYQRALTVQPGMLAADFNLGVIFQGQGRVDAAIAAYGNVLAGDPQRVAAWKNLGEVLLSAGRLDAWFANFRKFEANCPDSLALAVQGLEVLQHRAEFSVLEHYLDGLRLERYRAVDETGLADDLEQLLYLLLFFDIEPSVIHRFAQTYDATAQRVYGTPLPRPAVRQPGPIRIGYLSADLRNHVMGKMMWQALQHHDRTRFSIHLYSLSTARDAWTERFIGAADSFEVVANMDESSAAARIAAADLDLLVDLSTHTNGAKPGILALKPARVQLTHVASAGTVGLSAIDFKLTDRFADVPESQTFQIEPLLPMAGCVYPFRRVVPAADHPFHRAALGIAPDALLIGAFVTPMKLSRRCLGLWRDVLQRVPRAKLVFSPANPAFRPSYLRLAAAGGIPADRLLFLPQGRDDAENQARYSLIDLVLDTMPFGGVNGTLEALDAGVPVVTLVGKRHGERTSYSILTNLGVGQTIARSGSEYVEIAARLADDPAFMRDVRAAIAAGLAGSPLVDAVGQARALEAAYLEALARRAPDVLQAAEPATPAGAG